MPLSRTQATASHLVDASFTPLLHPSGGGRVVGVTGATGAPGRTFLSINLAVAAASLGRRVALVDADPHLGSIAVQLDLAEDRSLSFLGHEATLRPVDNDLVTRHMQTAAGIDVLTGRAVAGPVDPGREALLADVVTLLRGRYDLIVVDVGALDCIVAQDSALTCHLLVWVIVPTMLGIDLFDRTVSGPLASQVRTRPSLAVLNRLGRAGLRDADRSLRQRYGMAVAAAIPEQSKACLQAEDNAVPAAASGALAGSLRRCAGAIVAALPGDAGGPNAGADELSGPVRSDLVREASA
jgi:MinD-like ATPase involved in chromosome partitioning or flagellar assembly